MQQYTLGSQYAFIARLLAQNNMKAEVGVLFTDRGKVSRCLGNAENRLVKVIDGELSYYRTNADVISAESQAVFGNMLFPASLMNKTKIEERDDLIRMELKDVYKKTWFCHTPVWGMPCGRCNPCKDAIAEGMPERVPFWGRVLGIVRAIWHRIIKLFRFK